MIDTSKRLLQVERLKASHFQLFSNVENKSTVQWLQSMVMRGWISTAEKQLSNILPASQPICVVAIENKVILAYLIIKPNNKRRSCLNISFPRFLASSVNFSPLEIQEILMQEAIEIESQKTYQTWLARSPSSSTDNIAIAREIGFQPIKLIRRWKPNKAVDEIKRPSCNLCTGLEIEPLRRSNAFLLWQLVQINESIQIRQSIDNQWTDLLSRSSKGSRLLIKHGSNTKNCIFGLINVETLDESITLKLVRNIAWDSSLNNAIPNILANTKNQIPNVVLETSNEDDQLNNLLNKEGWINYQDIILLCRGMWRRQITRRHINSTNSIDSMIERLQPKQQPQLPTPSMCPR